MDVKRQEMLGLLRGWRKRVITIPQINVPRQTPSLSAAPRGSFAHFFLFFFAMFAALAATTMSLPTTVMFPSSWLASGQDASS